MGADHFVLDVYGAPGDTIALSPLVRDFHATHPDKRLSIKACRWDEIYAHDKRVVPEATPAEQVLINFRTMTDRSMIDKSARYLHAATDEFVRKTGLHVPLGVPKPELILNGEELTRPYSDPYCILAAGSKGDIPVKQAAPELFAGVVAKTKDWNWLQVGEVVPFHIPHRHWAVDGAQNLLGRTTLRQLFRLIYHAEVVLSHVSLPMLVASAFDTPCVVIGGGREDPWFFDGSGCTYLHTIGKLDCCKTHGCRTAVAKLPDDIPTLPNWVCKKPAYSGTTWVGACMTMFTPDEVIAALESVRKNRPPKLAI